MGDKSDRKKRGLAGAKKTSMGSFVVISEADKEEESAEYSMYPCPVGDAKKKKRKDGSKDGNASAGGAGKPTTSGDSEKGCCGR